MSNVPRFIRLCEVHGSPVVYHKDDSQAPCPCRTMEGYRDPIWHLENPDEPVCNESGFLPGTPVHKIVKGFIQPAVGVRASRLTDEFLASMFGTVRVDDHIGILPVVWQGTYLNFQTFSQQGEDYVEYHGRRFLMVNANLIPDPSDGNPEHHWELGLRVANQEPL